MSSCRNTTSGVYLHAMKPDFQVGVLFFPQHSRRGKDSDGVGTGEGDSTYRTIMEHKPLARSARLSVSSPSTFQEIRDSLSSSSSGGLFVEAGLAPVKSILQVSGGVY